MSLAPHEIKIEFIEPSESPCTSVWITLDSPQEDDYYNVVAAHMQSLSGGRVLLKWKTPEVNRIVDTKQWRPTTYIDIPSAQRAVYAHALSWAEQFYEAFFPLKELSLEEEFSYWAP